MTSNDILLDATKITAEELQFLEELINDEIFEHLDSGYKVNDTYIINLRNLLKKLKLKEKYNFDRWLDE